MRSILTPALATAVLASSAHAQWLELDASMIAHPFELFITPEPGDFGGITPDRAGVTASFVFSTTARPIASTGVFVAFAVADFEAHATDLSLNPEPPRTLDPSNASATIIYFIETDTLTFNISNSDDSFLLSIKRPSGAFSSSMTSLPDAPGDYSFAGGPTDQIKASYQNPTMTFAADTDWSPADQYENGESIVYMLKLASAPEPDPCSEADLALPFGVLDFSDVLAFLSAFGAGCP